MWLPPRLALPALLIYLSQVSWPLFHFILFLFYFFFSFFFFKEKETIILTGYPFQIRKAMERMNFILKRGGEEAELQELSEEEAKDFLQPPPPEQWDTWNRVKNKTLRVGQQSREELVKGKGATIKPLETNGRKDGERDLFLLLFLFYFDTNKSNKCFQIKKPLTDQELFVKLITPKPFFSRKQNKMKWNEKQSYLFLKLTKLFKFFKGRKPFAFFRVPEICVSTMKESIV